MGDWDGKKTRSISSELRLAQCHRCGLLSVSVIEPSLLVCAAELRDPASVPTFQSVSLNPAVARNGILPSLSKDQRSHTIRDSEGEMIMSSGRQRSGSWQVDTMSTVPHLVSDPQSSAGPGPQTMMNRMTSAIDSRSAPQSGESTPVGQRSDTESLGRRARPSESEVEGERGERSAKRQRAEGGRNLYGSLHVQGVKVPAPEGGIGLWFLFTVS